MGCSNSVGISKPTTMTSSGSFSRKSGQLEVTQLRTYCLHFSKPSTTLGLAPKAVSAIKKHHIFSSGEFGGETPQSEIHRDVAVVRAAPPVRGKTMVKLTSIDQPVNQEAESTPNNRNKFPDKISVEQNHITSREDRDLQHLAISKERFYGGVCSMQELNTPTVVRCRNFSNHTDKL